MSTEGRLAAGLCLWPLAFAPLWAGEIASLQVWSEKARHFVHLEARLAASPRRVRERLTDYDHLDRLGSVVRRSRLLEADPPRYRVLVESEGCIGFFCRPLRQEQLVTDRDDGYLIVEDVPGRSDFRLARAVWRLQAADGGTRLTYSAELEPDFWLPPLIGPALFRARLAREARRLIDNLERLAGEAPAR